MISCLIAIELGLISTEPHYGQLAIPIQARLVAEDGNDYEHGKDDDDQDARRNVNYVRPLR
jgi:hypothetical protein